MNAGDVIKTLRKKNEMTQEDLARALGLKKSSIQKYENGMVQNLKADTLRKLCNLFRVPPWFFIFPEEFIPIDENEEIQLRNQAYFIVKMYTHLNSEGRMKAYQYLEDLLQIEKYHSCDMKKCEEQHQMLLKQLKYYTD